MLEKRLRIFFFWFLDNFGETQGQKTRKRTRNPEKHNEFQRKSKVQKGLEHETRSGKVKNAKTFREQIVCQCKKKCAELIDVARQKLIHNSYYNLKNWSQKTLFLRSIVKIVPSKENLNPVKNVRNRTKYNYYLIDSNFEHQKVCQQFVLKCLRITQSSMQRAIKSSVVNANALDLRGKFPTRKTKDEDMSFVMNFIRKFPCYSSHYGSSSTDRMYLNPNLNIIKLYREYAALCRFENRTVLSENVFRDVFNTKFNLAFKPKKTDTCRTCDRLNAQMESVKTDHTEMDRLSALKDNHLDIVKKIKKEMDDCIEKAKNIENRMEVFTFDLQRSLEVPSISTSEAFYRRMLWVYNLCIYDEVRGKAYMYVWNESIASRGADEVFSCLYKYISEIIPKDTQEIIAFSDTCPGQNRNIKTTTMLKKILASWPNQKLQRIEQRFFASGHSYNACDRCFSVIERQKKVSELVLIPQHWVNIISQAKKKDPTFTVVEMRRKDFVSSARLQNIITNRKKDRAGKKINWLRIQRIIYERSKPFELFIEYYSSESQTPINVSLKKKGSKSTFSGTRYGLLYAEPRAIDKKNLMICRNYYNISQTNTTHFTIRLLSMKMSKNDRSIRFFFIYLK